MDIIIRVVGRIMAPFIFLFGAYIAVHGHLSPGGAFPGGVIIATAFALLILTYTEKEIEHKLTEHELIGIKSIAAIIIIVLILKFGYSFRSDLLKTQTFFNLWSGGFTPFLNLAGAIVVATALVAIIYSILKEVWKVKK